MRFTGVGKRESQDQQQETSTILSDTFPEQQPHIWRSSSHISGGAAATYLEEQQPHIWCKLRIKLAKAQIKFEPRLATDNF